MLSHRPSSSKGDVHVCTCMLSVNTQCQNVSSVSSAPTTNLLHSGMRTTARTFCYGGVTLSTLHVCVIVTLKDHLTMKLTNFT